MTCPASSGQPQLANSAGLASSGPPPPRKMRTADGRMASAVRLSLLIDFDNDEFAMAVFAGLSRPRKILLCRFFYHARASELFEEITRLSEYYPYPSHSKASSTRHGSANRMARAWQRNIDSRQRRITGDLLLCTKHGGTKFTWRRGGNREVWSPCSGGLAFSDDMRWKPLPAMVGGCESR